MARSRAWIFTLNNYTEEDEQQVMALSQETRYIIVGKEVGEEGTPHYQGYLYFYNARTRRAISKKIKRAWLKIPDGTPEQNRKYCSKQNNLLIEKGDIPKQGERKDLCVIKDQIIKGEVTVDQILIEDPYTYHQYGRTLEKIEDIYNRTKERNFKTECEWYYGETGVGKTHKLKEIYNKAKEDGQSVYIWKKDGEWQDAYKGQDIVIIDEYRGEIKYSQLLSMIDDHPFCQLRRRGREPMNFVSKKVYITSSLHPEEVYHRLHENDKLDQLMRRIKVTELKKSD